MASTTNRRHSYGTGEPARLDFRPCGDRGPCLLPPVHGLVWLVAVAIGGRLEADRARRRCSSDRVSALVPLPAIRRYDLATGFAVVPPDCAPGGSTSMAGTSSLGRPSALGVADHPPGAVNARR